MYACKIYSEIEENKVYEIIDECKKIGVKSLQFNIVNEPLSNNSINIRNIASCNQIHSDKVLYITKPKLYNNVDGLITHINTNIITTTTLISTWKRISIFSDVMLDMFLKYMSTRIITCKLNAWNLMKVLML